MADRLIERIVEFSPSIEQVGNSLVVRDEQELVGAGVSVPVIVV